MRWRGLAIGTALLMMVAVPGRSCGPFFLQAVFTTDQLDLNALHQNTPTIISPFARPHDLAIAYRVLNGPPLTPDEWATVLARPAAPEEPGSPSTELRAAIDQWRNARNAFIPTAENFVAITERSVPGNDWESYTNCLADAYLNAARTLTARMSSHRNEKAELTEWLQGQDAVFSNCGGAGNMPTQPANDSPLWLRQDRAYQTAAAHFYRMEWPEAKSSFESIAADKSSPWHDLADYLVARCLIRQSSFTTESFDPGLMRKAEQRLTRLASGSGPMAGPAAQLLDLVQVRTAPGAAAARLGERISKPDPYIRQNLIDFGYVFDSIANAVDDPRYTAARRSELVDWVLSMRYSDPDQAGRDHPLQRWRQTQSPLWLAAAMTELRSPDPELMKAAAEVPHNSPAWATVTYHRLRLAPNNSATWSELEHIRTELSQRGASLSTQNLFTVLAREQATTLNTYMNLAPLYALEISYDDGSGFSYSDNLAYEPTGKGTMAGIPVNTHDSYRLDTQSAFLLNEKLPLSTLVTTTLNSKWPRQLRFELAMAVWTRAVLLNRQAEARLLTSILITGEPGWKPFVTAYDSAQSPSERAVTGLLAMMRFPSVRPYINSGAGRGEGFVGYSYLRDNWWCSNMGMQTTSPPQAPQPLPSFITPAMSAQTAREQAQLQKIGDAPAYFGRETLAWAKAHPKDPRASEVLGFAFRAMRNGCNLEASTSLRRGVFDTLHTKYPQSEWAKHYPDFITEPQ